MLKNVRSLESPSEPKIRNEFNERSRIVSKLKKFLSHRALVRPLALSLLLIQSGCRRYIARWGDEAVAIGLLLLLLYGIWNLAAMGRDIIADYRRLRKSGKVSMENLLETVKPDFLMMVFILLAIGIPTAAFRNFDTIQGLIDQAVGTGLEVPPE